jgi:hypothetical protein
MIVSLKLKIGCVLVPGCCLGLRLAINQAVFEIAVVKLWHVVVSVCRLFFNMELMILYVLQLSSCVAVK